MTGKIVEELQNLGFSEYEAKAYATLLEGGPQTGYEVAKRSGIPRPNIYPVLDRLRQRGAVNQTDAKGQVRYSALPSEAMLEGLGRKFEAHLGEARNAFRDFQEADVPELIWNVEGYDHVIERGKTLVEASRQQLLVGVWANESGRLVESVSAAEERGVEVTSLCVQGCADECGGCRGRVYRYDLNSPGAPRWLVVVRDRVELLVGQFHKDGSAQGATTKMPAFVATATKFIENTIALAEVSRSLGPRLPKLLDKQAREALQRAGMRVDGGSWLERIIANEGKR